jgi:hypothetical protein
MGIAAPAATEISGKDYKTAEAFEKRTLTRDQIVAELRSRSPSSASSTARRHATARTEGSSSGPASPLRDTD